MALIIESKINYSITLIFTIDYQRIAFVTRLLRSIFFH